MNMDLEELIFLAAAMLYASDMGLTRETAVDEAKKLWLVVLDKKRD